MPVVPLNYAAILVAAATSIVTGFLWYGPIFGKQWVAAQGWGPEKIAEAQAKGGMWKQILGAYVASVIMAFVLAHSHVFASTYLNVSGLSAGLQNGFWNWLGFIVPFSLSSTIWEGQDKKLWAINVSYALVNLLIMGVIIAMWQ